MDKSKVIPDYQSQTVAELRAIFKARSLAMKGLTLKANLIAALRKPDRELIHAKRQREADNEEETRPDPKVRRQEDPLETITVDEEAKTQAKTEIEPKIRKSVHYHLTVFELQMMIRSRGLDMPENRKAPLVAALDKSDAEIFEKKRSERLATKMAEQALMKSYRARKMQMLCSQFKADPKRTSFSDLPWELREMIYKHAIFSAEKGHLNVAWRPWKVFYNANNDSFVVSGIVSRYESPTSSIAKGVLRFLSMMDMLSATNKQIREESRAIFFGRARYKLFGGYRYRPCENKEEQHFDYMNMLEGFLLKLGRIGRAELRQLDAREGFHLDLNDTGHQTFGRVIELLGCCKSLRSLHIKVHISYFFRYHVKHLEGFLLRGESLNLQRCKPLTTLAKTLEGLNVLEEISINNGNWYVYPKLTGWRKEDMPFMVYASGGSRGLKLWAEVRAYLKNRVAGEKQKVSIGPCVKGAQAAEDVDGELLYKAWLEEWKLPKDAQELMDNGDA